MRRVYKFSEFDVVSLSGKGTVHVTGEGNGAELTIGLYGDQFEITDIRRNLNEGSGVVFTIFGEHEREAFIEMLCRHFNLQRK